MAAATPVTSDTGANAISRLIARAELMGSRGRARMYGRPEPEDRDHDYVIFTDDAKEHGELNKQLRALTQYGFALKPRPDGFLTASKPEMDISYYPTAKKQDIHKAWALQEAGMSKDDAWAKIDSEKLAYQDALAAQFTPDYTPEQMENLGVYDALYRGQGPRLASLGAWKPEWISEHDPKGWAQWYKRYAAGRRIPEEDERQMKRWLSFKARHGGPFAKNPTARRGWALRNWGIDPANLVTKDLRNGVVEMLDEYQRKAMQKHLAKSAKLAGRNSARQIGSDTIKRANEPIDFDQWHGKAFKIVSTPEGKAVKSHTDGTPVANEPGQVSIVTPENGAAWNWPSAPQETINNFRTNWSSIQGGIGGYKMEQIRRGMRSSAPATPITPTTPGSTQPPLPQTIQKVGSLLFKQAELLPEVQLQEHQQRIADRITGGDNRLLVYHGLGSGKSLSALAAAEAAKKIHGDQYGVVVPAALRGNFEKEVNKFTRGSNPEILSYTGLGVGKKFQTPPQTLVMDEAHRLRNPGGAAANAASREARSARNLLLLTGSPVTNSPTDLANLLSLLHNKKITPEDFEKRFIGYKNVSPGIINWLRGIQSGEQPVVKNESELRGLLKGKVDYQPSKTPDGVNVEEQVVPVPLSPAQQKIQKAIRTKIPPGFLWKLDREFPLSRDELSKLNSFLTGLRQISISTRPFRADKDPNKAFEQSAKLQQAFKDLQETLTSDERKKAIIYSNHIDAGLAPYAAALGKNNIPHALFHGGISARERQRAVNDYNEGKLRALLIGPAGAEGLSTKGTSLIQLLDPHWHESRSQQAKGRGLRFDSHRDLPEELKNVAVRRYISSSEDPSWLGKLMGYQRERTGDEILENLAKEKEMLNDKFREILKQEGAVKAGAVMWFREKSGNALAIPATGFYDFFPAAETEKKKKKEKVRANATPVAATNKLPAVVPSLAGLGVLSTGLAYGLGSDEHMKNLSQALQTDKTPLGPDDTAMTRYVDIMSRGARSKPFGVPVGNLISKMRSIAPLMKATGVPDSYITNTPGRMAEARAHYDLFARGPIAAYHHMLFEARQNNNLTPAAQAWLKAQPDGSKTPATYGQVFGPRFNAAYKKWMAEQTAPGGELAGGSGWLHPNSITTKEVSHEKQMDFLRRYIKSLPPELQKEDTELNAPGLEANKKNYLPIFNNAVAARDALKTTGFSAGGAATGAVLAHILHRLANRKKKKNPQEKDKPGKFDPSYLASVLAGTGLGGVAGYYAAQR